MKVVLTAVTTVHPITMKPLTHSQIQRRLQGCARLPSLSTINSALRDLMDADQRYGGQVADIVRRDPSLTERLLRLVNSVYYGLSTPVNSINDAVFQNDLKVQGGESWRDLPASYHNLSGSFSFADGHSEIHKWFERGGLKNTVYPVIYQPWASQASYGANQGRSRDYEWLADHMAYTH